MSINESILQIVLREAKIIEVLEERIAQKEYGCSYGELNYDEQELVTIEAKEMRKKKNGRY